MSEDTKRLRAADYLEATRTRLALIKSALIGVGHEPDPVALSAAIGALQDLAVLVEDGLRLARQQDAALDGIARAVAGDAARSAAVALSALPAGSELLN